MVDVLEDDVDGLPGRHRRGDLVNAALVQAVDEDLAAEAEPHAVKARDAECVRLGEPGDDLSRPADREVVGREVGHAGRRRAADGQPLAGRPFLPVVADAHVPPHEGRRAPEVGVGEVLAVKAGPGGSAAKGHAVGGGGRQGDQQGGEGQRDGAGRAGSWGCSMEGVP